MKLPCIAIVGRMNVGKSTLFNKLTHTEDAIISSFPGTTRDLKYGSIFWRGRECLLVDTGGMDVEKDEQLEKRVVEAAQRAIKEADVILFVIDGLTGVLPQERKLLAQYQKAGKPIVLGVNKIDGNTKAAQMDQNIYSLGIKETHIMSAVSGRGTGDILDALFQYLPLEQTAERDVKRKKIAIVGRPNVGKSSLINSILGEDRVIVADAAHTTRDANDIQYDYEGKHYMLIDTAGIRKQAKVGHKWGDKRLGLIEKQSVDASLRAIERADVVLFVVEAQKSIAAQDKKIAQIISEHNKALIIVVNKWDVIPEKDSNTINDFIRYFHNSLPYLAWAPMIFISAKEHVRVTDTLDLVGNVLENYNRKLTIEELEPLREYAQNLYKPKKTNVRKHKAPNVRFFRFEQTRTAPPHFYLQVNKPKDVPRAIPDILERELRERFDFDGVKIIIEIDQ
ncbi:MAG: ribosome biogenesis GTPase Der [Candidatus Kerfeldbacteria bacterium]|nr:ribosome biogenesis GTPase Der [Candidatus Kerfeldbacteria bacterium]